MTYSGNNSLDLLLGLTAMPSGSNPAGSSQLNADADGHYFGDVLGDLLLSLQYSPDAGSMISEKLLEPTAYMAVNPDGLPSEINPIEVGGKLSENPHLVGFDPVRVVSDNVVAFNKELQSLLPVQESVPNMALRQLLKTEQVNLEAGNYEIVNSSTSNGTIHLDVIDKKNNGSIVKLSIDTSLLEKYSGSVVNSNKMMPRVELNGDTSKALKLEELLSKLNLKEIVITPVKADKSSTEQIQINILGDNEGKSVVVGGRLNKGNLRTFIEQVQTSVQDKATGVPVEIEADKMRPENSEQRPNLLPRAAVPIDNNLRPIQRRGTDRKVTRGVEALGDPDPMLSQKSVSPDMQLKAVRGTGLLRSSDLLNQWANNSDGVDAGLGKGIEASSFSGRFIAESTRGDDTSTFRTARFTLPDNIQSLLRPNGKAISIMIEPEHLGPARLSLTMHQDKLRARVFVDSFEAKILVEHSLDRLTRQLAKADIKVDFIEVSVNSEGTGNELFERQPHWNKQIKKMGFGVDDSISTEKITSTWSPPPATVSFAGQSGVNILA